MPSLGPLEVLIILTVAVLVLPPHKLPEVARQVGRALGALRRFQGTLTADFEKMFDERDETPKLPPKAGTDRSRTPPEGVDGAAPGAERAPDGNDPQPGEPSAS